MWLAAWKRVGEVFYQFESNTNQDNLRVAQKTKSWNWSKQVLERDEGKAMSTLDLSYDVGVIGNHWAIRLDDDTSANAMERVCTGQHIATNSLFINIARLLWTFAFCQGFDSRPLPFPASFVVRSPQHKKVVEEAFRDSEQDDDVLLNGIQAIIVKSRSSRWPQQRTVVRGERGGFLIGFGTMDHLPRPNDPVIDIESFYIPFLSHDEYDGKGLKFYPDRKGWTYKSEPGHVTFEHHGERVSNGTQIASFLQTWLYFGFLSEVTGQLVDSTQFRKETTSGNVRVDSSCLADIVGSWSKLVVEESWSSDPAQMQPWVDHRYGALFHVREIIVNTAAAESRVMPRELMLVCLGIAVLGEYVDQALTEVCRHKGLQPPATQNWWSLLLPNSPADPLLDLMEARGWCPNRIVGLQLRDPRSLGMLWYFANLAPPKAHGEHLDCTPELCTLLQVDLQRYETLHDDKLCRCPFQGPPADTLAAATEKGIVSLVTVAKHPVGSTKVHVTLRERREDCAYVAISHVWADGKGNLSANTLPQCVLRDLQNCANALSSPGVHDDMPFWIDTLCLPREPLELRRKGVAFLSDAFRYATHVLVIDSYLRSFHARSMAPIEVLARILSSDWNRRLWTLSEARLGRRVWVQFKDYAVEIAGVIERWKNTATRIPCLPSIHVVNHIIEHMAVTTPMSKVRAETTLRQIPQLRLALQTRTTTWGFDEPICLSTVMGVDTRKVVEAPNEQKMQVLWSLVSNIPAGLAFSPATRKLSNSGYRWAPMSLMGDLKLKHPWGGPENLTARHDAKATPRGLEVKLPGILFKASSITRGLFSESAKSTIFRRFRNDFQSFVLRDVGGYWYRITLGRHREMSRWHQDPASMDVCDDEPAIILDSAPTHRSFVTKTDVEVRPVGGALLVTYPRSEVGAPVLHVKAHTHAVVSVESKLKTAISEKYRVFCDNLSGRLSDGAFRASNKGHDELRASFEDYARKSGLLDLELEEWLGSGWYVDEHQVLDLVFDRLGGFIDIGPYCEVYTAPEFTVWCID
ncbi:hypothetical protein AYL99_05329 [Fonsecaea erecta]|uniref:Heterokaryon incompatibility domain-containing protein n=1 Tax=Fonsecaea erecta TaxID=1367422 RepID=A0A178ZKL2_9EURO|nr:hypothetical protein AYL99_05329 [Fonsecaea erecta]OAP60327.1 hypothetical protein AYL99_05329 [Fonsecaea erecta]